jgi:hypothetical protein
MVLSANPLVEWFNRVRFSVLSMLAATLIVAAWGGTVQAQSVTLPASLENATGDATVVSPLAASIRRLQLIVPSAELAPIPHGSQIVGIRFRQAFGAPSDVPATSGSIADYRVDLGATNTDPGSMSTIFAMNQSADYVTVRSGPLTVAAGSYPAAPNATSVAPFGPVIAFTRPYIYQSGTNLVVDIRHTGLTGATEPILAAISIFHPAFATSQRGMFAVGDLNAPSGGAISPPIMQIVYRPPLRTNAVVLPLAQAASTAPVNLGLFISSNQMQQLVLAESQLSGLTPGSDLTGVRYRASAVSPQPTTAFSSARFDIELASAATTPSSPSTTVSTNQKADVTTVRAGPLSFAPQVYPGRGTASYSAFGPRVEFQTAFTYKGGGLSVVTRSGSWTGGTFSVDALANSGGGFGLTYWAHGAFGADATVTTTNSFLPVMRLEVSPATVIPNRYVDRPGTSTNSLFLNNLPVTELIVIDASQLRHIPVGGLITGLSLRHGTGQPNFPASSLAVYPRFDVTLATATTTPATFNLNVASNLGADQTLVREGPLALRAQSFVGAAPGGFGTPWAPTIQFDRPFTYTGGNLAVLVRHSGHNLTFHFADAVATATDPLRGVAYQHGTAVNNANATTLNPGTAFPIFRLHYIHADTASTLRRTAAGTTNANPVLRNDPRTLQLILAESELARRSIRRGSLITGMAFRLRDRPTFPVLDTTWSDYTVRVSTSPVAPAAYSTTFALNEGADGVIARTGPMTIPARALVGDPEVPSATVRHPSFPIGFDKPFVYQGGAITITIRHTGNTSGAIIEVDSVSTATVPEWGNRVVGLLGTINSSIATTGDPFAAPIVLLSFTPPAACSAADIAYTDASPGPDGQVDNGDFSLFISSFFSASCTGAVPCNDADIAQTDSTPGADGWVDNGDFSLFISAFFAGCP